VLVISLPIAVALLYRINVEERALVQALGEHYRAYIKRTKRLIPLVY
jgi:protein-S-isoprenylcysteine O-methyltransferase Ste14